MTKNESRKGTVQSALIAPLPTAFVLMIIFSFFGGSQTGAWAFITMIIFAYPVMIFIGIPIHLILIKFEKTSVLYYAFFGFIFGVAICHTFIIKLNFDLLFDYDIHAVGSIKLNSLLGIIGMSNAVSFWAIFRFFKRG